MNPEQNDPGLFQGASALNRDSPEVFVDRQHDTRVGLGQI